MRSRSKRDAGDHPVAAARRGAAGSTESNRMLLVLLQILVVGQRQGVHHACSAAGGRDPGRLRAQELARVGVLLLGMIDEPLDHASGSTRKPNSLLDHRTISAPRRERCVAQVARR